MNACLTLRVFDLDHAAKAAQRAFYLRVHGKIIAEIQFDLARQIITHQPEIDRSLARTHAVTLCVFED